MKEWVEYCNATSGKYADMRKANGHVQPFKVKYWSIGNENYGFWEIGRKTPETWGPLVHQCAKLMRAADPDIKLAAAAWLDKREWNMPLLKAAGQDLEYMAVHSYFISTEKPIPYKNIVFSSGPEKTISSVINLIEEAGFRGKIKIAYDEWNLRHWYHPGFPRKSPVQAGDAKAAEFIAQRSANANAAQYSMADALFSASFFNSCLRHCEDVGMANIAPIVNTRGPLYVHPRGVVKRTTFHTLAMYASELQERVGNAVVEAEVLVQGDRFIPVIDAVATVDRSRKTWAIALVNRHPSKPVVCTVRMKDALLDGQHEAIMLGGDSPDAFNDVEHPNRVVPERVQLTFSKGDATLPPHSLSIVKIPVKP
jgi:alpha-N-arabinofuranosidase